MLPPRIDAKDKLDAEDIESCTSKVDMFLNSKDPSSQLILSNKQDRLSMINISSAFR